MNRLYALAVGAIALGAVAFVSGSPASPGGMKAADEKKENAEKAARPTTVVFNMAAVMRDFGQAKYQVWLLNNKKSEMSKDLLAWRSEHIQHQQDLQKNPQHPEKEAKKQRILDLARMIEDEDRKINKLLNDDASAIISDLYDKIKIVVDKTAELNDYHIVFSYPDAVTEEEKQSPYIKELKLKPPAAQPFYVAPKADITSVVVKTLNTWYPPVDPKTGLPVDVSKLEASLPVPGQNSSKIQLPPGMMPLD
jgi:Skp family chaperone for outer membrane proteins